MEKTESLNATEQLLAVLKELEQAQSIQNLSEARPSVSPPPSVVRTEPKQITTYQQKNESVLSEIRDILKSHSNKQVVATVERDNLGRIHTINMNITSNEIQQ